MGTMWSRMGRTLHMRRITPCDLLGTYHKEKVGNLSHDCLRDCAYPANLGLPALASNVADDRESGGMSREMMK